MNYYGLELRSAECEAIALLDTLPSRHSQCESLYPHKKSDPENNQPKVEG